jgi:hypothetical protein
MKVLGHPSAPEPITNNVLYNYKFYAARLKDMVGQSTDKTLNSLYQIGNSIQMDGQFISSTPSICIDPLIKSRLIINKRYVNYKIGDRGDYINQSNIVTKNVVSYVDTRKREWTIESDTELKYNECYNGLYVGLEDVRIFGSNGKLFFNANRGLGPGNMVVEHGLINLKSISTLSNILDIDGQQSIEKNWVMFQNADRELKMIYGWKPLKIGDVVDHPNSRIDEKNNPVKKMVVTHEFNTPNFFRSLRGSTNGQRIGNEIWFICHLVSYEDRRYYYHIFVSLDAKTMELKRYSRLFTFEKEKVEYTLGFVFLDDTNELLIGYSLMDRETKYMTIPKSKIEEMFI